MTPWAKIYTTAFNLHEGDDWCCAKCQHIHKIERLDCHHINSRSSMGGQKKANRIENLQTLCRSCHDKFGDDPNWKAWLFKAHRIHLREKGVPFDEQWMQDQITRWEGYAENS